MAYGTIGSKKAADSGSGESSRIYFLDFSPHFKKCLRRARDDVGKRKKDALIARIECKNATKKKMKHCILDLI
jgi:hypothetical protein